MIGQIDTERASRAFRQRLIDATGRLLISSFHGSAQSQDLDEPPNCSGLGRTRAFRQQSSRGWPSNPLPLLPAARALGFSSPQQLRIQLFQLSACNWRCWYCYVPFDRLRADPRTSQWISADGLIERYTEETLRSPVIILSGGQPDLVPEWVPQTMRALQQRSLDTSTYLWSDDNLSNDFFFRYLSNSDRQLIRCYPHYGRVGCFKGFDAASFSFNTKAHPDHFNRQFDCFERMLETGIDLYAYATFTTNVSDGIEEAMARFIDKLQGISRLLPLRLVPLEVRRYSPLEERIDNRIWTVADESQHRAIAAWIRELDMRFNGDERATSIVDIRL